jgi:hypothetical protein
MKLEEHLYENLGIEEELALPTIGDSTGTYQNVYCVVDLLAWMSGPREMLSTYNVVDGECAELPGYLVSSTPILYNREAPSWESPFEITPLTHTLVVDGEVIFGRRELALCGDADHSGGVDIDDVVYLIAYIFSGGPEPVPYESGDADCSGAVDIDDVVWVINYIFAGGNAPCDTDGDGTPDC